MSQLTRRGARRIRAAVAEGAFLLGLLLLAVAAVDFVAYGRFVRSFLFR